MLLTNRYKNTNYKLYANPIPYYGINICVSISLFNYYASISPLGIQQETNKSPIEEASIAKYTIMLSGLYHTNHTHNIIKQYLPGVYLFEIVKNLTASNIYCFET